MANRDHAKTYLSWRRMRTRCRTTYADKGVRIAPEWNNFATFLADMGERPEGKTLGRIDNEGDYCVENCRWETPVEQALNRKSTSTLGHYIYDDRGAFRVEFKRLGICRNFKVYEDAVKFRDTLLRTARTETLLEEGA